MTKKHDIETYRQLALGAMFYLEESFNYINRAIRQDYADLIFEENSCKIVPSYFEWTMINQLKFPENPIERMQSIFPHFTHRETITMVTREWDNAQEISKTTSHKFKPSHRVTSIEILGHLNNFSCFLEIVINRHLLFLCQTNVIDNFSYSRFSLSKIMEKMVYIFKDELNGNQLQLSEIQNLFRLRNKTVHFTPENTKNLQPKISELKQIWKNTKKLIERLESKEKFVNHNFSSVLEKYSSDFLNEWSK